MDSAQNAPVFSGLPAGRILATGFARLWQCENKRQEAHDLLAPVYNWFTEGFDTVDLQNARSLFDELEALGTDAVAH
jgi:predicted ATPase